MSRRMFIFLLVYIFLAILVIIFFIPEIILTFQDIIHMDNTDISQVMYAQSVPSSGLTGSYADEIAHIGFPIFVACYLLFAMERTNKYMAVLLKELILKIDIMLDHLTADKK